MGKKEREKAFFKLRAQVSSRAAARGQAHTLLLLLPSAPPQEGRKRKLCAILAQQQFFLPRRIRSLQIGIGHYVSDPILPCLLFFCFGIDSFGGILRFLEAFPLGVSEEEGFQLLSVLLDLRHLALVSLLVVSVFR
jgi:hypothetical protein